jgi:beta-1,4-mannosyl-glycoprotein beta-1,4-N-acetylglucosaminyltransferase
MKKKNKIYDCFTYFNEDQLLKLRLETLWDSVDFFVICEATRTHTGKEKAINFNINNFLKFKEKIRYLLIESYPFQTTDPWVYENYQRNYLINGLWDANDHDWVIISDLDEIPNPSSIFSYSPVFFPRASLLQYAYVYYLNNQVFFNGQPYLWTLPKITTFKNIKCKFLSLEEVRNFRSSGFWRGIKRNWMKFRTQTIRNGGWHFTWMGGVKRILLKMDSMAHQEFNKPENRDCELIEYKIRTGGDVLGEGIPGFSTHLVNIDQNRMPVYLVNNKDEFLSLILQPRL